MPYVTQADVAIGDLATAAERNTMKDNIHLFWSGASAGGMWYFTSATTGAVLAKPSGAAVLYHDGTVPAYISKSTRTGATLRSTASAIEFGYPVNESCSVYSTVNQNIPTDPSYLEVLWNAERRDNWGWHSTSVNTGRITPDVAGYYSVDAVLPVDYSTGEDNQYEAEIRLNGVAVAYGRAICWAGYVEPLRISTGTLGINLGDYFTVHIKHNKVGTRTLYPDYGYFRAMRME